MNRDSEIEQLAELVAKDHWRNDQTDPARIASSHGLTFNFGRYEDVFDGLIECKARRFHVYINLDSSRREDSPRARFSFAHELGHYFIDWHRHALERGVPSHGSKVEFESSSVVEREADLFAANLLMPRDKVHRKISRGLGAEEIQRLAQDFGTSFSATAIRCAHLSVAPMVVMKWSNSGRAWCWSSEKFASSTGNRSYRALDRLPSDSVTRQMLERGDRDSPAVSRGTTLATWFPSIWVGSAADEILIEECISLGTYGVLTILREP